MRSVLDVFANSRSGRTAEKPLYLGSVKSNVGHAESGSGVTSLIKVMMMLKHNEIPPHCGIKTKLNTGFPTDLEDRGIRIALKPTPWRRQPVVSGSSTNTTKRMAFLNNFSAAGGNSALLIEDAPVLSRRHSSSEGEDKDPRTTHVVTVSAKTAKSLVRNAQRLAEHLTISAGGLQLASVAYTTTARRIHHNYRISVTGQTLAEIQASLLQKATSASESARPISRNAPSVAFAFTGQGSGYRGMGQSFFSAFSVFRAELRRLEEISKSFGFASFLSFLVTTDAEKEEEYGPQAMQLALTCFEIALARLWESFGVCPNVVVGHSLGEYAALHIAGVISARDAVFLVGTRASIMQERCSAGTHAMLAVKAPVNTLSQFMESHGLEVACVNGPSQTVLAGLGADVDRAQEAMGQAGLKTTRLNTEFAFHSAQVGPVVDEFARLTRGVIFRKPTIPVISPLLATVVTEEGQFGTEYLARHCRETVNLEGAVQAALAQKVMLETTICLEIGPESIVTGMLKASVGGSIRTIPSVRKTQGLWATLSESLSTLYQAGLDLQWDEYHRDFNAFHEVVSLPAYQWDYKNHWIQYVHDWCLTKGDAPVVAKSIEDPAAADAVAEPKFLSATCQKVLQSEHGPSKSFVLVESDISHPDLRAVFEAHKVNGAVLCPSSVYADIAMTLGNCLGEGNPVRTNRGIEVADMATTKPLLMRTPGKSELFRVSAEADWVAQTARVVFYSVDSRGEKTIEHATCTLRFGNPDAWLSEWKRVAHLVRSRMQSVRDAAQSGSCHLIKRGMVYKLFENCVEYGDKFQGIEEVSLDSQGHEATARVAFKDRSTCFHANPYYIDSLGHLSGFIMNATESFDYKAQVFINHGWESIRCAVPMSADETYQTYVKMQSVDGSKYVGDVYIFQGDAIIGVNQGVAVSIEFIPFRFERKELSSLSLTISQFQAVPRKVLDMLLPNPSKSQSSSHMQATTTVVASRPSAKKPQAAAATRTTPPAVKRNDSLSEPILIVQAMNIIAEETGIAIAEMKNDLAFADVGVDSLLSLSVCGRFREELNIDSPSTLFLDYPTVRDLKRFLGGSSSESIDSMGDSSSSDTLTPNSGFSCDEGGNDSDTCSDITTSGGDENGNVISKICTVLADEIGLKVEEVWNAPSLAELGLDSLMSLTVLGRLRDELNIDLPTDFFLDDDMTTIRAKVLNEFTEPKPISPVEAAPKPVIARSTSSTIPPATSVVLQGNTATAQKVLFLFPDGSGSATSYATLPRVSPAIAVVGLNCPYVKRPQDLKCGLQDLTTPYLAEIRRRQPHGPYYLGGWSAGGISAYDAAATLMASGEKIAGLILLDSPNPIRLPKLPVRMYHFLNSIGMFGSDTSKPPPEWLLPHFLAFVDALARYEPAPFTAGMAPVTHAIWAADGVYKTSGGKRLEEQADDTPAMKWLLHDRTSFGPNGWDQLVGGDKLKIRVLEGANHFTMFEGGRGERLARFLAGSMGV